MTRLLLAQITGSLLLLSGCASLPDGIEPVRDFDLESYLGKWYELARLDHRFERNLQQVTAEYSMNADGSIRVVNRGYSTSEEAWKEAIGKAYPAGDDDEGYLKVSFFGPFYGGYCVWELGQEGEYAFVAGSNRSYLWLLSRTPSVSPEVWRHFETQATAMGFDLGKLVRVEHRS